MGTFGYNQIGNINPTEKVKIKLKVTDYIFTYQNQDLNNAYIEYYFDSIKYVEYKDGKKNKEIISPLLCLEISGVDTFFNTFSFSYSIDIGLEDLNKLSNNPNHINDKIIEGEIFFSNPYETSNGPISIYLEESMYHETAHFFVAKKEENKFVFKGTIPSESVFFWFDLDFQNNKKEE